MAGTRKEGGEEGASEGVVLRLPGALYLTLLLKTGNLQNKSWLSSAPDGTKPSSADWQTGRSLKEVPRSNLVLSHIPDVSGEGSKRACPEQPPNKQEMSANVVPFPRTRVSAVTGRGLQRTCINTNIAKS